MRVDWFRPVRRIEPNGAVGQAHAANLQNLPVEADRRGGEEFLECDEFRGLGLGPDPAVRKDQFRTVGSESQHICWEFNS